MTGELVSCALCGQPLEDDNCPDACTCRLVDWSAWRMCPVCRAGTGVACYSRSGRVIEVDGLSVPDGVNTPLSRPHVSRKARTGNRR
jgi:hypothetical protein